MFQTIQTSDDETHQVGQEIYVEGARGIDPNPYKIHEVLGNGQYRLSRDGKVVRRVFAQENLRRQRDFQMG